MRKIVTIGDLGTIITGKTPPTTNKNYYGDYAVFIKPTDISEHSKFTFETEEMYSKLAADKYKSSLVPKGAICVPCIGTIGTKMTMTHCDCYTNQSINSIVCNDNYDNEYVYYLIKNFLPGLKAYNLGTASGREYVSKSNFEKIELEIETDKDIQKRIGVFLSRYDSLIENYQKQTKLLEEATQRLYKEWFVDLRFPGHENTKIVDGAPEGWAFYRIGDIFKTVLGGTPSRAKSNYWGGNIPWINSGEINKLRIIKPSEMITKEGYDNSATKLMPVHTTILAITGATLGQVSYTEIETCANQSVVGIIDESKQKNEYLYLNISNNILSIVNKATGGAQQHINKDIVNAYPFLLPNKDILDRFKKIVAPMFRQIKNNLIQIESLTEARDRLLPKLMSGEITV